MKVYKRSGFTRETNQEVVRKRSAIYDKRLQISGLEGLVEEWENTPSVDQDYLNHLRKRLHVARQCLIHMIGLDS